MASSQDQLIQKLQQKVSRQGQAEQDKLVSQEVNRCRTLPLKELGAEMITRGRCRGQTVNQVYTEHLEYVIWLIQHKKAEPNFINLVEFTKRMEEKSEGYPQGSASLTPPTRKMETMRPSGKLPTTDETESDWEEMTPATMKESTNNETQEMFKSMMGAFSELKLRLDDMQQSSSQQQVLLHQSLGAIQQIQTNQENQEHRLNQIEFQVVPK